MDPLKTPSTKQIPVGEKLFTNPAFTDGEPRLLGSNCKVCGETVFPAKPRCPNCGSDDITEYLIGPRGKLYSFTIIYQTPPVGYKGPVPYGVVKVEMPGGPRITGYATENDPAKFKTGMEMELIIEKLFTNDDGNDVIGYKFKPVLNGDR